MRLAIWLRAGAVFWLVASAAAAAVARPATIYALELEVSPAEERLLVLADAPLAARVLEQSPGALVLAIDGAVLDRYANTRLAPVSGEVVRRATAIGREPGERPEVRIVIDRAEGPAPRIASEGSSLVIAFPASDAQRNRPVEMGFVEAPLQDVVRAVARATGETYAFDDTLAGSITILAPEPVAASEAKAMLDAALLFKGFVAVPMPGRGLKIVPIARAPAPWRSTLERDSGDAPVTTLLHLENADADTLLTALRPLLGTSTLGVVHHPTNGLILVGPERRLERLQQAIRALDAAQGERVVLWKLHHRPATEIAKQLEALFDSDKLLDVSADERLNVLILRARPNAVEALRRQVDRLDRPPVGRGALHVLPVRYVDANQLATILNNLQHGAQKPGSVGEESLAGREFAIVVDPHSHSLLLRADDETARLVAEVVAELDRIPPQVLVEATVAEITTGNSLSLGFDYLLPLIVPPSVTDLAAGVLGNPSGTKVGTGSLAAGYTGAPLLVPVVDAIGIPIAGVDPTAELREFTALTADERQILVRSIMTPSLLMSSGDEHVIFSGENVPVPVSGSNTSDALQTTQNIERKDVGVQLRVRPSVGQRGRIHMELDIDVSAVSDSLAGQTERVGPTISERKISTVVDLDEGNVAVIGFASVPRKIETRVGVPFLRSIPILGFLFRSTEKQVRNTTLLISVQATLKREESTVLSKALREELARERPDVAARAAAP
jgi:general secretion pathway protein D